MDREGGIRRRISRGMIPVLALHVGTEYYRLRQKPPVTAGLILANTLIYLRPGTLDRILPTINEVWFNPHLIVKDISLPFNGGFGYVKINSINQARQEKIKAKFKPNLLKGGELMKKNFKGIRPN